MGLIPTAAGSLRGCKRGSEPLHMQPTNPSTLADEEAPPCGPRSKRPPARSENRWRC
ncbi:protein of unknown function [Azospirillum lipoferum 4B]|uniref:Uncharacterized protein n=1 Tax=Azospirillum lipoferum (strain 4B) TaxID=862719 RepID=G7Z340_AZOL4|nr:protein of unknown function [Azospirillum lipoferum 4B]